jgi:hypothetical protein
MTPSDRFALWDCRNCGTLSPHPCVDRACCNASERDALIEIARLREGLVGIARRLAILIPLLLAGCGHQVTIDVDRWQCTRTGPVTEMVAHPAGRTSIAWPETTTQCTQWSRFK